MNASTTASPQEAWWKAGVLYRVSLVSERAQSGRRLLIALNFGSAPVDMPVRGKSVLSTSTGEAASAHRLAPNEGRIVAPEDREHPQVTR